MYSAVATKDPQAVQAEVQKAYDSMFPSGDRSFVSNAFRWAKECFGGKYRDYHAIDSPYHDFEHTLQGTLCMSRLLHGRHRAGAEPRLTPRMFELGIVAILLHDTGYLKKASESGGTGAKYTVVHVTRSGEFASQLLKEKGFSATEIRSVLNMIQCTGVDAPLGEIPFQSDLAKLVGFALGTSDLLGQIAADDYVEKLPILYSEFAEATHYMKNSNHFIATFSSAADLMRKTPGFWQQFVLTKLERDFGGLYNFLKRPYPEGKNDYVNKIERNMERLKRQLAEQGSER